MATAEIKISSDASVIQTEIDQQKKVAEQSHYPKIRSSKQKVSHLFSKALSPFSRISAGKGERSTITSNGSEDSPSSRFRLSLKKPWEILRKSPKAAQPETSTDLQTQLPIPADRIKPLINILIKQLEGIPEPDEIKKMLGKNDTENIEKRKQATNRERGGSLVAVVLGLTSAQKILNSEGASLFSTEQRKVLEKIEEVHDKNEKWIKLICEGSDVSTESVDEFVTEIKKLSKELKAAFPEAQNQATSKLPS